MKSSANNILVTSASQKIPMLKSLKKAIQKFDPSIKLIGGDLNGNCISRYFTDDFWEMPRISEIPINDFIAMLQERKITYIIPSRDAELSYLSKFRNILKKKQIYVMVSNLKSIEICLDKLGFYQKLKQADFPIIPTVTDISNIDAEFFVVKEQFGAGSLKLGLGLTKNKAIQYAKSLKSPIFQPYIKGLEVSVDAYIDLNHKVKGVIARSRDLVVNGESKITTSLKEARLEDLSIKTLEFLRLYGHCMLQIIIDLEGEYHIVECNSRFGGASSLSQEMGLESFYWFLLESIGKNLDGFPFIRLKNEKKLVRYPEDLYI